MFSAYKVWGRLKWPVVRAHVCTLAICLTLNATWRVPRDGFRYGGVPYGIAITVALLVVALPITLLQLAIGQLSQQDAVGIWRAVPFFKGIGYIRLLISFMAASYSMIYLSLTISYFLYSSSHGVPFPDCVHMVQVGEDYVNAINASECLRMTFMSPINENLEYYLALALIAAVLWIASPFMFYNSVKLMKRVMYVVAPIILILGITIASSIGRWDYLTSITKMVDWKSLLQPDVWNAAVVQALWSTQIAGGFLIAAGDSVYANTNVQWSSLVITFANITFSWLWLIIWFSISGRGDKDTSSAAVIVQMYQAAENGNLGLAWPLVVYLTLILSGLVTMLVLLYPIYDRLRRMGGMRWRITASCCSLVGAATSLALLVGRLRVLALVEDLAVPLLVAVATVFEILALGFIYGWRNLIEDVEFLISQDLVRYWVWGWWLVPLLITPITTWWLVMLLSPWVPLEEGIAVLTAAIVASVIFLLCACITIAKQVQYDIFEKLWASFKPSRHWGPRDPITHYYWLARREALDRGEVPQTRYNRRELGQLSRRISFLTNTSCQSKSDFNIERVELNIKPRSNSDDFLYANRTGCRSTIFEKRRSKSLDYDIFKFVKKELG